VQRLSNNTGNYGFASPTGSTFDGSHIWVTNLFANNRMSSVTEFNTSDGSPVRTLQGAPYNFLASAAVIHDGTHLWVTNSAGKGGSVTEIDASDGSFVQILP